MKNILVNFCETLENYFEETIRKTVARYFYEI